MISLATLAQIAKYNSLSYLVSPLGTGAIMLVVDGPQCPQNCIGIVTKVSHGGNDNDISGVWNVGAFVCDETMGWGQPPLLPGGGVDPTKVGPYVGMFDANTGPGGAGANLMSGQDFTFLAPGQFIRFASVSTGPAIEFPVAGEFFTGKLAQSFIPICECEK